MEKENFAKRYGLLIGTGLAAGAAAVLLTYLGNPDNMGFCIACFLRDIAGALNLQRAGFDAEVGRASSSTSARRSSDWSLGPRPSPSRGRSSGPRAVPPPCCGLSSRCS